MGRFKEKTTVTEKIPLDAVVDDSEKQQEENHEQEQSDISASEQRYLDVARRIAGFGLKFRVFRIIEGVGERYIKSLSAEQFDVDDPTGSLRSYFGGGIFKVYFVDPESREEISSEFEIEGEPKFGKEETSGGGITLNVPKQGSDATTVAMVNFMSAQLSENQKLVNNLIVKLADRNNQPQGSLVGGMTLEQLGIIKELFASKDRGGDSEKLKEWIGLARTLVDNLAPLVQPQSDNPLMTFLSMVGPKVSEVLGAWAASKQQTGKPIAPAAATANRSQGTPVAQAPAEQPGADVIRQVFEQMYFAPLLEAAKDDLDPYTMTFNFKAQMQDTTQFFSAIGLSSIPEFYERYPAAKDHRGWFDEFFYYMINPTAKPEADDEDEESEASEPPNGKADDVVLEAEAIVTPEPKKKKAIGKTEDAEVAK